MRAKPQSRRRDDAVARAAYPERIANMTLNFPNSSRSYDATRMGVRFWGHDRSMETAFLVTADALRRIAPGMQSEAADLLRVFDRNRERIHAMAARLYARNGRSAYALVAADV